MSAYRGDGVGQALQPHTSHAPLCLKVQKVTRTFHSRNNKGRRSVIKGNPEQYKLFNYYSGSIGPPASQPLLRP